MALDPNNLTPNKINLSSRISQPLRSVMSTGKRMMSNGKFIKSMRTALAGNKSDGITDKVAKKMALRLAVGVKALGVTAKKEKGFFNTMKEKGMLSAMYKNSVKNAITHYKTVAGATTAANDNKEMAANDDVEKLDQHHRMQKIRDDIEEQKHEKQEHEVSATQNFGRNETGKAVSSADHLVHQPDNSAKLAPSLPEESSDPLSSANTAGPVQLD